MHNFSEKPMKKMSIFFKKSTEFISTFKLQPLLQKQYLTINEVQVRSGNSIGGCLACPQVYFENEVEKMLLLLSPPL